MPHCPEVLAGADCLSPCHFSWGRPLSAAAVQASSCFPQVLMASVVKKPYSGGIFNFPSLGRLTDVISLKMLVSSLSRPSVARLNCKPFQFWLRGFVEVHSCRAGCGGRPVPVCWGPHNFSHCSGDKILQKPCFVFRIALRQFLEPVWFFSPLLFLPFIFFCLFVFQVFLFSILYL